MTFENATQSKPPITLARSDHDRLWGLAEGVSDRNPEVSSQLLAELDRAEIVPDERIDANVVRMGSTLRFTTDTGEDRTITLVFPSEADISAGKVSILTPIGAALIGLSAGQSIDWTARDGQAHRLTVESVNGGG
ncbi:MAG: nucleoside diphosphate kinase regulator [Rhodospirillaceae bacterium]|nr:nucleoside diphosphate kinase regulator [Magnetovibrio sp.]MAY67776.1 nucleoside diphosphate kinase regulator [Rhodospirillaceae bacterium]